MTKEVERSPVETVEIDPARRKAHEILKASVGDIPAYIECRRQLETALSQSFHPSQGYLDLLDSPDFVADRLGDTGHPSVQAAFLMAAAAHRAAVYARPDTQTPPFSKFWDYRPTRELARESEALVARLLPKTRGLIATIDLDATRDRFWQSIKNGDQEGVIVTGLDGSRKSTTIKSLIGFMRRLGLKVSEIKFPRTDSSLGSLAKSVLRGEEMMDPRALQFLMLADALDYLPGNDFSVYDRHPTADALIYGPAGQFEVSLLAARELFISSPHWLIIIDRHPANCLTRVNAREGDPELFEQGLTQMIDQTIRFASLTTLPGAVLVNNDIPPGNVTSVLALSAQRVTASLTSRGTIQRALVQQGVSKGLNEANHLVWKEFGHSVSNGLF